MREAIARVVTLVTVVVVAGCSGNSSPHKVASTPAVTPTSTPPAVASPSASGPAAQTPAGNATGDATPSGQQQQPQPLPGEPQGAPAVAVRPGAPPVEQRAPARAGTFQAPAQFPDGTNVSVQAVSNTVSDAKGAGTVAGQAVTRLTLQISNGSGPPLDLDNVVVTVTYGAGQTHAAPVYDEQVQDFAGSLGPGRAAKATYAFAVPADQRQALRVYVDVDGRHLPAELTGSA